jgi:hypothetical protein
MANQATAIYDRLLKHQTEDYRQYNSRHRYRGWMGTSSNSIIVRDDSLRENGETVRFHFTGDLGYRNIGTGTLEGNEGTFGTDYYDCKPIWYREATRLSKHDSAISALNEDRRMRDSLKAWQLNIEYAAIEDAFDAITISDAAFNLVGAADGSTVAHTQQKTFLEATEAERDAFLTANVSRLQFGNDSAAGTAGDMSASLAALTAAGDGITIDHIERLREKATIDRWREGGARPLQPVTDSEEGREAFKLVVAPPVFRILKNLPDMVKANLEGRPRGLENHPIFQAGDLIWNNVIISQDYRARPYGALGASGAIIYPTYFFGGQAIGCAIRQRFRYTKGKNDDYEFFDPVGVESSMSYEKLFYRGGSRAGLMAGMIMGFVAVAP